MSNYELYFDSQVFTGFLGPQGPSFPETQGLLTSTTFGEPHDWIVNIMNIARTYLANFIAFLI
jgi:hypothetical protein